MATPPPLLAGTPARDAGGARLLLALAVLAVLYAGVCKALLFRGLEYYHTDVFGFLEMSRGLFLGSGQLLRDNAYGQHGAIHNYYLMLLFAPLTLPLGAYGLFAGLVLLHAAAAVRAAVAPSLDLAARMALLGVCLGPIAFFVFDNSVVGFNPELCYPPLVLLLALDLREGRTRRALVPAALVVLAKEDGALVVACVLVAFHAPRLWAVRSAPAAERRRAVRSAALGLLAAVLVFALGMLLLLVMARAASVVHTTAEGRIQDSLRNMSHALAGRGLLRANLFDGLAGWAGVAVLTLLPLGRRLWRGLGLLLLSAPPLVAVLLVSSGTYRFRYMTWPHRIAPLVALGIACMVVALASRAGPASRRALASAGALVAVTWGLQLLALDRVEGYAPLPRLRAVALAAGKGTRAGSLPGAELRFLRCLGDRLPAGLPVSATGDLHPALHRQSVVFEALEAYAWHPARLRVVPASSEPRHAEWCRDAGVGGLAVEAECELVQIAAGCREMATAPGGR